MALSLTSIGNFLFKRAQGKSSTNDARQFFEEPIDGRAPVYPSQVWSQADSIPNTAPVLADLTTLGVVRRYLNLQLTAVPGTTNAFFHANLKDAIPFNFGDGSYNYQLTDSTGAAIPFGAGDWIVDPATGTLTFYGTVPANMPARISFYQYVGPKGVLGTGSSSLTLTEVASDPAPPAAGQDTIYFKTDGKPYRINAAGLVSKLGSGGGGGTGKNYFADLYDGSAVTGFRTFNAAFAYTFAAGSSLVDLTADSVNYPANNVATGQAVVYTTSGTVIGGLTGGSTYYAIRINATTFSLATTLANAIAGTFIDLTSQGTGNHTFTFDAVLGQNLGIGPAATGISITPYSGTTPLPLRPTTNQRISKAAGSQIGQGVSIDVTLDPADYINGFSMRVEMLLRGSANYSAADLSIQVYDLTNNKPLKIGTGFQKTLGTVKGIAYIPGSITTTSIRVIITCSSINTNAWDLDLIDLTLEPLNLIVDHFRESALIPTLPPPGITQVYAKPTGKLYRLRADGVERPLAPYIGPRNYFDDLYDGLSNTGVNTFNGNHTYAYTPAAQVDTALDTINYPAGPVGTGQQVLYQAGTTVIGGLTSNQIYFAVRMTANTFGLATSLVNANSKQLIDLTSQGSGTQTFTFVGSSFALGSNILPGTGLTAPLNTTLPLRSTSNLRLSKNAQNRQGYGWSIDLTLDPADLDPTRMNRIAFKYRTSANYVSGDVTVHLEDLVNNQVILINQNFNEPLIGQAVAGTYLAYFNLNGNSGNYRLVFTAATVNANAFDLDLIDLEFGVASGLGPVRFTTPWVNYGPMVITSTGTAPTKGTTVLDRVWGRRNGQNLELRGEYQQSAAGSNGTGSYLHGLPAALIAGLGPITFDASLNAITTGTSAQALNHTIGRNSVSDGTNAGNGELTLYSGTQFRLLARSSSGNTYIYQNDTAGFFGLGSAATLSFGYNVSIPVVGWTEGNTYTTPEVLLKNQPFAATSATKTPSSGTYMAMTNNGLSLPVGTFDLGGGVGLNNGGTSPAYTGLTMLWAAANGADTATLPAALSTVPGLTILGGNPQMSVGFSSTGNYDVNAPALTVRLTQPATIYLVPNISAGTPANARVIAYPVANKRPDYSAFTVIPNYRSFNASYRCLNNFAASSTVPVNFDGVEYDESQCVTPSATAWRYTCKASGLYLAQITSGPSAPSPFYVYKGGAIYKYMGGITTAGGNCFATFRLALNEYVDFRPSTATTMPGGTLSTNNVSILSMTYVGP